MTVALLLSSSLAISCGSDDEPQPNTPEQPTQQPVAGSDDDPQPNTPEQPTQQSVAGTYGGWTLGSNDYAAYIPSEGDTLVISLADNSDNLCNLTYSSPTWGTATLTGVSVVKNDTAYLFSKPVTATLREDHSAWDFSATVDSIAMPNRNPQTEEMTIKNYPFVLTSGTMSLDGKNWQIDFDAYLVPRSAHVQHMSFRNGLIQRPL